MISMNKKMDLEIQGIALADKLPSELTGLLGQGFLVRDGCVFLAALALRHTNVTAGEFPDKTGYECFVNSIHIDDYVGGSYLAYACLFVETCFAEWRSTGAMETIKAIIACDEFGAVVKIHAERDDESWLGQDLEQYEEALLIVDSSSVTLR